MIRPYWLATPLAGTFVVLAGLAAFAVPLRKLTSAPPPTAVAPGIPASSASQPAVLRLKLLTPAERVRVSLIGGEVLLDLRQLAAGESEHDLAIPWDDGHCELDLEATFSDPERETAVFLTLMPDGYPDQTAYALGTGAIEEALAFDWSAH